ncbi:MAG: FtsQ-type POTRA domain-containing protein [Ignavibacteriales bacterium]|nr:FtsQ-type POTRA domain-containing protein [Ignavibacteriales bacterium]
METKKVISTEKRIRRLGIFLTIPLVAVIIVLCFLGAEWRETLPLKRIIIDGARILPVKYINTLSEIKNGTMLNDLNLNDIQKKLSVEPFIKNLCVTRQYPDAININITERVPIATVNSQQLRYIDDDGVLLPYLETAVKLDLPIINGIKGIENAKIGKAIENSEIQEAIQILQTAIEIDSTMYRFISEVNMKNGDDVLLFSTEAAIPIIIGRDNYPAKLLMLQTFWSNYVRAQNADRLKQIDLRFNDQVVVKWVTDN